MLNQAQQQQQQQMLIDELVLTDNSAITDKITALMPSWYSFYTAKSPEQQYWYVRRCLLMFLQARVQKFVDYTTGPDKVSANQMFKNIGDMLLYADKQLAIVDPNRGVAALGSIMLRGTLPDSLEEVISQYANFALGFEGNPVSLDMLDNLI